MKVTASEGPNVPKYLLSEKKHCRRDSLNVLRCHVKDLEGTYYGSRIIQFKNWFSMAEF